MISIVLSGASSGIGAALALHYAAPETRLLLVGRNRERLEGVAARCRDLGAGVDTACLDVRDYPAVSAAVLAFDEQAPIDVVIGNAGVTNILGPGECVDPPGTFRSVVETNVIGVFNLVAPGLERMLTRRSGRIGLISSLAGLRGLPYSPAYSCTKAALRALGDALRVRALPQGVSVTVVYPGYVDTPMDRAIEGPKPFRLEAAAAARIIARAVERRRPHFAFPAPLVWGLRSLSLLPTSVADAIVRSFRVRPRGP